VTSSVIATLTGAAGAGIMAIVEEVAGLTNNSSDGSNANVGIGSGSLTLGSVTTTNANDFLTAAFVTTSSGTATWPGGAGFTSDEYNVFADTFGHSYQFFNGYKIVSATGTYTATVSMTINGNWASVVTALK
jgi:hypothetical protein